MKGQLPVVSFQPEGHDQFMALMMLMVGVTVEVTYLRYNGWVPSGGTPQYRRNEPEWEVTTGIIEEVTDEAVTLSPYGIPKRYTQGQYHLSAVPWAHIKMLEVLA